MIEINLFYIEDNLRERIIFENNIYKVNNTKIEFSETKILEEGKCVVFDDSFNHEAWYNGN